MHIVFSYVSTHVSPNGFMMPFSTSGTLLDHSRAELSGKPNAVRRRHIAALGTRATCSCGGCIAISTQNENKMRVRETINLFTRSRICHRQSGAIYWNGDDLHALRFSNALRNPRSATSAGKHPLENKEENQGLDRDQGAVDLEGAKRATALPKKIRIAIASSSGT